MIRPPQPPKVLGLQRWGFLHVGQACLELLTSGDPPALASQSAEITGMSHHAWPMTMILKFSQSNHYNEVVVNFSELKKHPLDRMSHWTPRSFQEREELRKAQKLCQLLGHLDGSKPLAFHRGPRECKRIRGRRVIICWQLQRTDQLLSPKLVAWYRRINTAITVAAFHTRLPFDLVLQLEMITGTGMQTVHTA
ncbi:Protein GVQW1, partial [Plecturocebus cupreus]